MKHESLEQMRRAFADPSQGIEGLADRLLDLARTGVGMLLEFDQASGGCQTTVSGSVPEARECLPILKSVFRAALVRFSILCRDQSGRSVSPYGGFAELQAGPGRAVLVVFANTPDTQRLQLSLVPAQQDSGTMLAAPGPSPAAFPVDDAAVRSA